MEEIESLIQTHCFIVSDAILYGIEEAILLHNIKFWVRDNKANSKNFYDGRTWTYNSAKAFSKIFPYWTTRKISRLLDSLEKKGAIVSGNYNKAKYDRTKWYALSQEPSDLSKMTNGFVKSVQPIPDINTDINNSLDISCSRKSKKFVPPTVEEVQKYIEEINSSIDAQFFVDYYTDNNWKDKNDNPVKNWKLKLRIWDMRERKKNLAAEVLVHKLYMIWLPIIGKTQKYKKCLKEYTKHMNKKNECEEIIHEKCLIATMLYNEDITKDHYRYIIDHVPIKMFFNKDCKRIYDIIYNTYDTIEEGLLGTDLYRNTIEKLYDVETDYESIFTIQELESYWYPKSTFKHWIREVQSAYYTEAFRLAETEEEFQNILAEQQKLTSDTEMQLLSDNLTIIEDYEKTKGTSITTPWKSVNSLIGSMQGGDMIVLAGSTGCGKTCFMLNLAIGIAEQGKTVDIFSLEMPRNQLVQRIACSQTGVDAKKFRTFTLTNTDIKKLRSYLDTDFKKLKINVFPRQKVSISEIERIEKKSKSDIIFIDYLGLIEGDKRLSRYDRFSEISRTIKLMAMVTNKPVIALHQLNREFMQRDNKEPQLSDLRESGQIEQDSDMVWFVYRPGMFDGKTHPSVLKFKVAKNRHAEIGVVDMTMDGDTQKIVDTNKVKRENDAKVYFISKTSDKEESLKNDNNKTRKRLLLPSKQYAEFEKEAVKQLLWKYGNMEAIDEPINLKAIFYREANYKSDLVNYMQALQDVLVKAGILKDDNVKIVQSIDGSRVLTDKESPRIEVTIERLAQC